MNIRKPIALSLIALTITAPGLASASSLYHAADGEVGVTTHPDHVQSTVSRDDVLRSVEIARKDGSLAALSRGGSLPTKATSSPKTREQVRQEYLNMSAEEKQQIKELYGTGG